MPLRVRVPPDTQLWLNYCHIRYMTKKQRQRLYIKSSKTIVRLAKELGFKHRKKYNRNPKCCKKCKRKLPYKKRYNKFCNHACSASYITFGRKLSYKKRRNISRALDKYHIKRGSSRKHQKCVSCNSELGFTKKKYCNQCKPLTWYIRLFEKLKIKDLNLHECNKKALKILVDEYFNNLKSLAIIKNEYGIMFNTMYFFFKRNGIDLRSVSNAHKLAIKNGRKNIHANCKYKSGHHTTWFGDEIYYKSSYEKRVIDTLDELQEIYLYENVRVSYYLSKNTERIYVSDFYIPRLNLILETKSEWFQKIRKKEHIAKEEAIINEGYKFKMIGDKEISQFELDKNISIFA